MVTRVPYYPFRRSWRAFTNTMKAWATGTNVREPQPIVVVVLAVLAIGMIPVIARYYLWLARHALPRLVSLPTRLAIVILGLWVALPWIMLPAALWLVRR
jgi:hypothetical protein